MNPTRWRVTRWRLAEFASVAMIVVAAVLAARVVVDKAIGTWSVVGEVELTGHRTLEREDSIGLSFAVEVGPDGTIAPI